MDIREKVAYWIDVADYDIKTARHMHKSGRYLYTVFMCQQATEKILKALYIRKFKKEAPFSHNLVYLQGLLKLRTAKKRLEILAELTSYYIEGRYPTYKVRLSKLVDKTKSRETLAATEEIYKWLKSKVQQKKR